MLNTAPFKTHEFPQAVENPLFRIAWISQFHLNPHAMSEPSVDLIFTPYLYGEINPANINSKSSYNYAAIQTRRIGVGQLAGLYLGAFVRDRAIVAVPDYGPEKYDLVLDDASMQVIRADATYEEDGLPVPYIPSLYYPLPQEALSTRCLVVERDVTDEKEVSCIIFPCPVLLITYFATSSNLVKEIIKGRMDHIFSSDRTGFDDSGIAYLGLRPSMDDYDAEGVARFALDPDRLEEVEYIHESMLINEDHGEGYVPVVLPPFRGATKMVLHGKRIKSGRRWHYLVFRIEDCTGSYPFDTLCFSRDNDGRGDGIKDRTRPEAYKNEKKAVRHTSHKTEELEVRSDDEPSVERLATYVKLTGKRFSSTPTDVKKVEKDECRFRAADKTLNASDGVTTGLSTADGDYGETELDRLRISQEICEDLSDRLRTFREVLEEMERQEHPNLSYRMVKVPTPAPGAEDTGISFFPDKYQGKTLSWSFLSRRPKERRRVSVAEVQYHGQYFYLFEAEKRPPTGEHDESISTLVIHRPDGQPIGEGLLARILLHGARKKGVWLADWEWHELRRVKFVHSAIKSKRFTERFAERFIEYFRKVLSIAEAVPSTNPPETPDTSVPNVA